MPIHYALFENNLTADPADYAAQIQITGSADLDQIAGRMIELYEDVLVRAGKVKLGAD